MRRGVAQMPTSRKQKTGPLKDVFLEGVLVHNPVLVQVIGICPVVAAAVSLRTAALLAGVYSLVLILTEVIASAALKKTIRWVRVMIYLLIGLAVISPFSYLLEKNNADIRLTVGIYLSLLAANSLAVLRSEKIAVKNSVKYTFFDSLAASIGYSAVLLLVGFVRELLGSGTVFEKSIRFLPKAPGMLMPFGGFIVLGFMAAALRTLIIRHYPQYAKAMVVRINPMPVTLKAPVEEIDSAEEIDGSEPDSNPDGEANDKIDGKSIDETDDETPEINVPATETEPDSDENPENAAPSEGKPENEDAVPETEEKEETDDQNEETIGEEAVSDTKQNVLQEKLGEGLQANQPENLTDTPGSGGIDLKFQELLHFLEECDNTSEDDGSTDC